jgi:hypothetical protein
VATVTALDAARWCAAGSSLAGDGVQAGDEAVREALAGREPAEACLAVVFAGAGLDLAAVAAGLRSLLPQRVPVIGCTTSGEIAGTSSRDASLALMLFGGSGFDVRTAVATGLAHGSAAVGQEVAELLYAGDEPLLTDPQAAGGRDREVVLLLSDGLAGDQQAMVTGVYRVTGAAVPLVGGCAGDDLAMLRTHQLIGGPQGDRVVTDAVVGVRLRSRGSIGIGVRHGWRRVGEPLVVTGAEGTTVATLDDQPALDVYLGMLRAPGEAYQDAAAFTRFALRHPLGVAGRGQDLVRFVTGADLAARSLQLVSPVPPGGITWIMTGDVDSVLAATEDAVRQAVAGLHGEPPRGVLAFDCIARRAVLGEATHDEVARIRQGAEGAATIGFYTYGEIARTRGINGFHNQTLVVLAVS